MVTRRALAIPAVAALTLAFLLLSTQLARSLDEVNTDPSGDAIQVDIAGQPLAPGCPGDIVAVQLHTNGTLDFYVSTPNGIPDPFSAYVEVNFGANSYVFWQTHDGVVTQGLFIDGAPATGATITREADGTHTYFYIPAEYASSLPYYYVETYHMTNESDPTRCYDQTASVTLDLTPTPTEAPTDTPTDTPTVEPTNVPTAVPSAEPTSVPPTNTAEPTSPPAATSTVASATQAPAPPSTGSGAGAPGSRSPFVLALAGAMIAAGGGALVFSLRRA